MHFPFKTRYEQDIALFKHGGQKFWYAALAVALLAAPFVLTEYALSQFSFIGIYAIVCLGLMLLSGFTGQVSLGHAGFLAMGAYTEAWLQSMGWPFVLSLSMSALVAGITGILVGLPALRIKGMYLAIATLAFGFIIEEAVVRAEHITGGNAGRQLEKLVIAGIDFDDGTNFYYLVTGIAVLCVLGVLNLLRSPTGRAFVAIRDSEVSAQSMGINIAHYKTVAFALSAALAGIAGALYAHKIRIITPDQFGFLQSIELLMMVVIGGLGAIQGAIFGPAFWFIVQQVIVIGQGLAAARAGPADRPATNHLRFHPDRRGAVRADGPLRPLAEVPHLPADLPLLSQGHVQAAEVVHEVGADEMTAPMLEAANLSVRFGGLLAVNNVSFEVWPNEVFSLIGPNGAGKTTIFNLISSLYRPTSGEVRFEGEVISRMPPHVVARHGIARTFQNIELFEHATVLQNLLVGRHCHRHTGWVQDLLFTGSVRRAELEFRRQVEEVIEFLDLQHYRDSLVVGLPYGVRKVVELGRALSMRPQAAAARRAVLGPQHRGNRGHGFLDRGHQGRPRHHGDHGRARHGPGLARLRPRAGAQPGRGADAGHAREVQAHPGVIEAYLGGADDD
jgi:branched-chain amino acid transport system permease protein